MNQKIKTEKKTVKCPIDGCERTVYVRALFYDNAIFRQSLGCNEYCGRTECEKCIALSSGIADAPNGEPR